jgi:hypothetical protein
VLATLNYWHVYKRVGVKKDDAPAAAADAVTPAKEQGVFFFRRGFLHGYHVLTTRNVANTTGDSSAAPKPPAKAEKKKGGIFALCCGSKAQEQNFSS